ncbi:MAG: hypothetical protein Q9160_003536 [Pyrenula sp. 1 TL-2023]
MSASTSQSSVNDLITHLRQTQLPSAGESEQSTASAQSPRPQRTVHPSLRNLLDIPDTPPPKPRPVQRPRVRRVPGPPPPESWLNSSRYAPSIVREQAAGEDLRQPVQRSWVNQDLNLPGCKMPSAGTLVDLVCRSMIRNWFWHREYDGFWLSTLPVRLKEVLLSYIAIVALEDGSNLSGKNSALNLLWPREGELEASLLVMSFENLDDASEVKRLDLSGALGRWMTMKRLHKQLLLKTRSSIDVSNHASTSTTEESSVPTCSSVPDTWEDLDQEKRNLAKFSSQPTNALSTSRFSSLTHLSLALSPFVESPTSIGSWSSLLDLSAHLSILRSLSLANWPLPTLTPNARASNAYIRNPISRSLPTVRYGGSDMYTEFDSAWDEASNILRRLSRNLYCLQWLDLRGCSSWWGALTWSENAEDGEIHESPIDEEPPSKRSDAGPEWNGAWRGIQFLGLEVGWTPSIFDEEEDRSETRISTEQQLSHTPDDSVVEPGWDPSIEKRKYYQRKEEERYKELVQRAETTAKEIQAIRRRQGGQWINTQFSRRPSSAI